MSMQKLMFVSLCAVLGGAASAHAAPRNATPPSSCVLSKYDASAVAPYRQEVNVGYGSYTTLKGAQVFVPAREGLTEQWLARDVQNALATSCDLAPPGVEVRVVSGGTGFWVQLIAASDEQGEALLSWARNVVRHWAERGALGPWAHGHERAGASREACGAGRFVD